MTLEVGRRDQLTEGLAAGRLDAVFLFDNGVPGTGNVAIVGHDRTVVVAAPDHPLARERTVALDTLLKSEFLVELRLPTGLATIHIGARWRSGLGAREPVVQALPALARRHVPPGADQIAHDA